MGIRTPQTSCMPMLPATAAILVVRKCADASRRALHPPTMPFPVGLPRQVPHFGARSHGRTADKRSKGLIAASGDQALTCTYLVAGGRI